MQLGCDADVVANANWLGIDAYEVDVCLGDDADVADTANWLRVDNDGTEDTT